MCVIYNGPPSWLPTKKMSHTWISWRHFPNWSSFLCDNSSLCQVDTQNQTVQHPSAQPPAHTYMNIHTLAQAHITHIPAHTHTHTWTYTHTCTGTHHTHPCIHTLHTYTPAQAQAHITHIQNKHTDWFCVSIWHKLESSEDGASVEEMLPWDPAVGIFSVSDQWGRTQLTVGGAIPGLVVLGSIRKPWGSKPVSSPPPWPCISSCLRFLLCLSSCPDFLHRWTMMWKHKLNKLFPPNLLFDHGVSSQQWKP
jgi:hypothetical protein